MCWVGGAHTKGIVVRTLSGYSLSLARRPRYSVWPLKRSLNVIASSLKTRFGAPEPLVICHGSFGPNSNPPAQSLAVCFLACRTRTARNRRVKDVRRSVTGPLSAASIRAISADWQF